jgi:hypothetical protein
MPYTALWTGLYSGYVRAFCSALGRQRVHCEYYEDLVSNPATTLARIWRTVRPGVEDGFWSEVDTTPANRTGRVRAAWLRHTYVSIREACLPMIIKYPTVATLTSTTRKAVSALYHQVNTGRDVAREVPPEVELALDAYFSPDRAAIEDVVGRPAPRVWSLPM